MVTEGYEQYFKLGKTFLNPWNDLGKTYLDICRRAHQETLELAGDSLSRTAEQLKRLGNAKRPEEMLNLQKECLNENLTAMMSDFQKLVNISLGSFEELNKAFTTNLKDQQQTTSGQASASKMTDKGERR